MYIKQIEEGLNEANQCGEVIPLTDIELRKTSSSTTTSSFLEPPLPPPPQTSSYHTSDPLSSIVSSSKLNTADPKLEFPDDDTISVDSEQFVDIFINDNDHCKLRCPREILIENSGLFKRLLGDNNNVPPQRPAFKENDLLLHNVDVQDVEIMLKFFQMKHLNFRSTHHTLRMLTLAEYFECAELYLLCIRELDLHMNAYNVLDIFCALYYYHDDFNKHQTSGGRIGTPKGVAQNGQCNSSTFIAEEYGKYLLQNSLQFIDENAEKVLSLPRMHDLRFEELQVIVKRESLHLNNEWVLFKCLLDWSKYACLRRNLKPIAINQQLVLGPLCMLPRYLLMTCLEFRSACACLELYRFADIQVLLNAVEGIALEDLNNKQIELFNRFITPRPRYSNLPKFLSERSNPKNSLTAMSLQFSKKQKHALSLIKKHLSAYGQAFCSIM